MEPAMNFRKQQHFYKINDDQPKTTAAAEPEVTAKSQPQKLAAQLHHHQHDTTSSSSVTDSGRDSLVDSPVNTKQLLSSSSPASSNSVSPTSASASPSASAVPAAIVSTSKPFYLSNSIEVSIKSI